MLNQELRLKANDDKSSVLHIIRHVGAWTTGFATNITFPAGCCEFLVVVIDEWSNYRRNVIEIGKLFSESS